MSTNHTPNYQLSQWERTDRVLMEDFNADNAKIDAALGTLAGQVSGKADASALAAVSQSRNCQAATTSYTGTGTSGENAPSSVSFSRIRPSGSGASARTPAGMVSRCTPVSRSQLSVTSRRKSPVPYSPYS